jgi:hypothetical protein
MFMKESVLGDVHQLIIDHGVETARNRAGDKLERQCIDAAFSVLSDEDFNLAICHSGFALTALPHRSLKDRVWERTGGKNGEIKLRIESGATAAGDLVGIPSGAIARLLPLTQMKKQCFYRFTSFRPHRHAGMFSKHQPVKIANYQSTFARCAECIHEKSLEIDMLDYMGHPRRWMFLREIRKSFRFEESIQNS